MKYITVVFKERYGFDFISIEGHTGERLDDAMHFDTVGQAKEWISGEPEDDNLFKILIIEEIEND